MLSLLLQAQGEETPYLFKETEITIGASPDADIAVADDALQSEHVKIYWKEGRYIAENCHDDPEITLNSLPFGSRTLRAGDTLTFGSSTLQVVDVATKHKKFIRAEEKVKSIPLPGSCVPPPTQEEAPTAKQRPRRHLGTYVAAACLIFFGVGGFLQFVDHDVNETHEIIAAQGVADISMAITYAREQGLAPYKQNWNNTTFLSSMLDKLLPKIAKRIPIDSRGKFEEIPYRLNIYTNNDGSHFLLVAKPEHSWIDWLNPQEAIVLNSQSMELRKLADLTELNGLVFKTKGIDKSNALEIEAVVDEGDLIALEDLDQAPQPGQFAPPIELAAIAPGAERRVFNAPRYFKFTDSLIDAAKKQPEALASFDHFVFYSSGGEDAAIGIYSFLSKHLQDQDIMVGYFAHDPTNPLATKPTLLVAQEIQEDPIQEEMAKLKQGRSHALEPLTHEIIHLLQANLDAPEEHFKRDLVAIFRRYETEDNQQQQAISSGLQRLYHAKVKEEQKMTKDDFLIALDEARLRPLVKGSR